jgi:hypothetical protein
MLKKLCVCGFLLALFVGGGGCAVIAPAVAVGVFGSDEDCAVVNTTVLSSVGCTGAQMRKAVIAPFSGQNTPRSEVGKERLVETPPVEKSTHGK